VLVSEPLESRIKFAPVQTEQALDARIMLDKAVVEAGLELAEPARQRSVLGVVHIGQVPEPAWQGILVSPEIVDHGF